MDKPRVKRRRFLRITVGACFTALTNGYLLGFAKGKIFTGATKAVCVPGLNCYSCPGALGACPLGSLQSTLASRNFSFAFYVTGFLMIVGAIAGRFVCGFLCPFGLVQELLYKIPFFRKLRRLPGEKYLRLIKYFMLAVLVILLPLFAVDITGQGSPWFCKLICPAGTLGGGIPLVAVNEALRGAIGFLYTWKVAILIGIILLSIVIYRPFCRYICPLGAIYGLFNRFSLVRYKIDTDKCTHCGACRRQCGFDIPVWKKPNSVDCIRCGDCRAACPEDAISIVRLRDLKRAADKEKTE